MCAVTRLDGDTYINYVATDNGASCFVTAGWRYSCDVMIFPARKLKGKLVQDNSSIDGNQYY